MSEQELIGWLKAKVETLESEVRAVRSEVTAIRSTIDIQKGSWKTLLTLISAAAAAGSLVTMVIEWFNRK